jgi:hypothetical protein
MPGDLDVESQDDRTHVLSIVLSHRPTHREKQATHKFRPRAQKVLDKAEDNSMLKRWRIQMPPVDSKIRHQGMNLPRGRGTVHEK